MNLIIDFNVDEFSMRIVEDSEIVWTFLGFLALSLKKMIVVPTFV
jgi:hypothetical protein